MSLTKDDLAQFTGSETFYRHGLVRRITYTEGVQYVAEHGGAYWLIDKIATNQLDPKIAAESFQVWKFTVNSESFASLVCEDGNDNEVFRETITYTDFPLDEIRFYCDCGVIMLPSEY
jgi:hypothetical protein